MKREVMQELIDKRQEQRADIYKIERENEIDFTINGHKYQLLTNYRDAFQTEKLEERFSSILSKYDYIVGDWGFDQLRLKGFYLPENPLAQKTTLVDTIQDYLYEYCNFGCAYFVIRNLEVKIPKNENNKRNNRKRPAKKGNAKAGNKTTSTDKTGNRTHSSKTGNNKPGGKKQTTSNSGAKKPNNKRSNKPRKPEQKNNTRKPSQNKSGKIKPQIKEREVDLKTPPVSERKNQTATRVNGNNKNKQKFVIRHK